MAENLDIHNKDKKLIDTIEFLKRGGVQKKSKENAKPISDKNIHLILDYYQTRTLEGKDIGTRCRDIYMLIILAKFLDKDFDVALKDDIKEMLLKLDSCAKYSKWTLCKFKQLIKRFYKWMKYGDEYQFNDDFPEEVKWIRKNFKKKDEPQIDPKELITEEQMKKLIDMAENPRDKAFMSILTESGTRIAEIGNLRIKDVYQDEFSYLIHIKGKTGERTDRVFYSDSYIAKWLNVHPLKDNPEAPLWINFKKHGQMKYPALLRMIDKICDKAGIKGRHNPHLFRHSRVTINARKGMSEPLLKKYFGWEQDSRMLSKYSHLISDDANEAILKMYGVKKEKVEDKSLKPNICEICHYQNAPTDNFCEKCARPLNTETDLTYKHYKNEAYKIMNKLCENPKFIEVLKAFMAEDSASQKSESSRIDT